MIRGKCYGRLNNNEAIQQDLIDAGYTDLKLKKWVIIEGENNGLPVLVDEVTDTSENEEVKFETYDIYVPSNTKLSIEENTKSEFVIKSNVSEFNKYISYDIKLKNGKKEVEPTGNVNVSIKIPTEFNKDKLELYYINSNSECEKLQFELNGDYINFTTKHFSTYAMVDTSTKKIVDENKTDDNNENVVDDSENKENKENIENIENEIKIQDTKEKSSEKVEDSINSNNPKTGDNIMLYVVIIGIAIVSFVATIIIKKKKIK